jgi:hypothetical protein
MKAGFGHVSISLICSNWLNAESTIAAPIQIASSNIKDNSGYKPNRWFGMSYSCSYLEVVHSKPVGTYEAGMTSIKRRDPKEIEPRLFILLSN